MYSSEGQRHPHQPDLSPLGETLNCSPPFLFLAFVNSEKEASAGSCLV